MPDNTAAAAGATIHCSTCFARRRIYGAIMTASTTTIGRVNGAGMLGPLAMTTA